MMDWIKSLYIQGFKKFKHLEVLFNQHTNILVGENEAGKSTVLDAIKTVLNQQYRNADKSILGELFNQQLKDEFRANPVIETLPSICIEVFFELEPDHKDAEYFYGQNNHTGKAEYGICFSCEFDQELGQGLEDQIAQGHIPYEYYALKWTTFAGRPYQMIKRPLGFVAIDTANTNTSQSFNYYNKALFNSSYSDNDRMSAKNQFREKLGVTFNDLNLPVLDSRQKFGIDFKKIILENIISIFQDDIALENKGSGMESLIKTKIALNRRQTHLDVVLLEEPENHLSFSNLRKMIAIIEDQKNESQIIIATHSSMIASHLNLNNVIWIANNEAKSLRSVNPKVASFFEKADDNSFLQLLLSKKAILVEGATEYLLVPYFYKQIVGRTLEQDNITIIACNGVSYKNYLAIVSATDKKIAVITDNDEIQSKIDDAKEWNEKNKLTRIFMDSNLEGWTWEACMYRQNEEALNDLVDVQKGAKYPFHGKSYEDEPVLGKMLNNKVETAYKMLLSRKKFTAPDYVEDAIKWISE
jgi:predicted ATP-dependent endonuclease of OLD family